MNKILTTRAYWNSVSESTKGYWQSVANAQTTGRFGLTTACTNRPSIRQFGKGKAGQRVRRCSTGGKWGKSADVVNINIDAMLAAGYIYTTYVPKAVRIAAKREAVYSNDNH